MNAAFARLANNMRFLIVPWARVPIWPSHVLGRIARRISRDWQAKYGHRVVLLETYVEQHRLPVPATGRPLAVRRPDPRPQPKRPAQTPSRAREIGVALSAHR